MERLHDVELDRDKLRLFHLVKNYGDVMDAESLVRDFADRLRYSLCADRYSASAYDCFISFALAVRDCLTARWIRTQQEYYNKDAKRVYYLSMEFLTGRTLGNAMINLGIWNEGIEALSRLGLTLEDMREMEWDAGLGNGGLGRLAACFLDSMASLQLPGYGYGIRYEYGIFSQKLWDGYQVETPDNWLRYANPWEIERPESIYPVKFYGRLHQYLDPHGKWKVDWVDTQNVMAMAYDTPVPGYRNNTVNTLRLWSSKSTREFNLQYFNSGDYIRAVDEKNHSETITKVLYPNDNNMQGKELRLKQEYLFVCATLQDILRRFEKIHHDLKHLPDKVAIQLNDTHPALAIPELMRLLVDERAVPWDTAWDITRRTFAYTNHTVLPEALEQWRVELMERVLPRHLQIIYEINRRFMDQVWSTYPGDMVRMRNMSIIREEPVKAVQMAKLAIVGSHSVNGVSALHSEILKNNIFKPFYDMMPEKFNNKTNGITQRRWLKLSNPRLSELIDSVIGKEWTKDLYKLKKLEPFVDDDFFRDRWEKVKKENKNDFAKWVEETHGIRVNPESMFDFQVKRIHEYKRQLLNVLHVIDLYNRIRLSPREDHLPRTVFIGGKAAPGYQRAKMVIKLINSVAHIVNNDPRVRGKLRLVFLVNYNVSMAQRIFPASELSEQISTAGREASGTGNMKFALNGALTIGTLDGANVEIKEEVGDDNIFIFGLNAGEVEEVKRTGYNPKMYYETNPNLKRVLDMIHDGYFSPDNPELFRPLVNSLLDRDEYLLLADFDSYVNAQKKVEEAYRDRERWTRMSIMNVANSGKFSSDRTIHEYATQIWNVKPVDVPLTDIDAITDTGEDE